MTLFIKKVHISNASRFGVPLSTEQIRPEQHSFAMGVGKGKIGVGDTVEEHLS